MKKFNLRKTMAALLAMAMVCLAGAGSVTNMAGDSSVSGTSGTGVSKAAVISVESELRMAETEESTSETESEGTESQEKKTAFKRPAITSGVKATSKNSKVYITWEKASNANRYVVYRREVGKQGYKELGTVRKLKYTDKTAKLGTTYIYRIRSLNVRGDQKKKSRVSAAARVTVTAINPKKKMLALTFDDGPGPYTQAIVDCLKKYGMHATFFVVGNRVDSYKSTVKSAVLAGCEIGNHSYDHPYLWQQSASTIKSQISKTNRKVRAITGKNPVLLRPPYGGVSSTLRNAAGMPLINWSVDTRDWETRSTSATISSVLNNAADGEIILMHDIHYPTQQAALSLIPTLVKKGYQLVTVSELAQYKSKKLKKGTLYYSIK